MQAQSLSLGLIEIYSLPAAYYAAFYVNKMFIMGPDCCKILSYIVLIVIHQIRSLGHYDIPGDSGSVSIVYQCQGS